MRVKNENIHFCFPLYLFLCSTHQPVIFRQRNAIFADQSRTGSDFSLFNNRPLNIFQPMETVARCDITLNTWEKCDQNTLFLNTAFAPRNYFEKMMYWTIEGKIWKFPIDNEQGKVYYGKCQLRYTYWYKYCAMITYHTKLCETILQSGCFNWVFQKGCSAICNF